MSKALCAGITSLVLVLSSSLATASPEAETATFTYTSKPLDFISFIFDGTPWNEPFLGNKWVFSMTDTFRVDWTDPPTFKQNGADIEVRFLDPTYSHYDWSMIYADNGNFNYEFSRDDAGDMLNDRIVFTHSASGDRFVERYGMNVDGRYIPMELTFANNTSGQWTPYDYFTESGPVSAVPEPTTYAMMFGGLALLGWKARWKSKQDKSVDA